MTLNEEVAVEVMGWTAERGLNGSTDMYWMKNPGSMLQDRFNPSDDLNQARQVLRRGIEVVAELAPEDLGGPVDYAKVCIDNHLSRIIQESGGIYIWLATAEQICQAVLMAVREARK